MSVSGCNIPKCSDSKWWILMQHTVTVFLNQNADFTCTNLNPDYATERLLINVFACVTFGMVRHTRCHTCNCVDIAGCFKALNWWSANQSANEHVCKTRKPCVQADRWLMSPETQTRAWPESSDFPVLSIDEAEVEKRLDYPLSLPLQRIVLHSTEPKQSSKIWT